MLRKWLSVILNYEKKYKSFPNVNWIQVTILEKKFQKGLVISSKNKQSKQVTQLVHLTIFQKFYSLKLTKTLIYQKHKNLIS